MIGDLPQMNLDETCKDQIKRPKSDHSSSSRAAFAARVKDETAGIRGDSPLPRCSPTFSVFDCSGDILIEPNTMLATRELGGSRLTQS